MLKRTKQDIKVEGKHQMNMQERLANLDQKIAKGELTRKVWKKTDAQGRELVCLLAALSPEAGEGQDASECPAEVMPQWLAYLTPWIDDASSEEKWHSVIRRYAAVAHRWSNWSESLWDQKEYQIRGAIVLEAMKYTNDKQALAICQKIVDLLSRRGNGEGSFEKELDETRTEANKYYWVLAADAAAAAATDSSAALAKAAAWHRRSTAPAGVVGEAADNIIEAILTILEKE